MGLVGQWMFLERKEGGREKEVAEEVISPSMFNFFR